MLDDGVKNGDQQRPGRQAAAYQRAPGDFFFFSPLSNPPYGIVVAAPLYVHKVSQLSVLLQFVFLSFKGGAQDNTQFFSAF